jgi:hypothetical protein
MYHPSPYWTDRDGRYAIPGLPGRGIVTVRAQPDYGRYPRGAGAEKIEGAAGKGRGRWAFFDTLPQPCHANQCHALAEVNPPEGPGEVAQDFELHAGQTLHGKVLDPEGRPLTGVRCSGREPVSFYLLPLADDDFLVKQYRPEEPRLLLFWHKERKLAGSLVLRGAQTEALTVRLEPGGVLTGRVVDAEGKPKPGLVLITPPVVVQGQDLTTHCPLPEPEYRTDQQGRFRIEGLASGVKYNVCVQPEPRGKQRQVIFDATVEPGQTKDLGDLTIKPYRVPGRKGAADE